MLAGVNSWHVLQGPRTPAFVHPCRAESRVSGGVAQAELEVGMIDEYPA